MSIRDEALALDEALSPVADKFEDDNDDWLEKNGDTDWFDSDDTGDYFDIGDGNNQYYEKGAEANENDNGCDASDDDEDVVQPDDLVYPRRFGGFPFAHEEEEGSNEESVQAINGEEEEDKLENIMEKHGLSLGEVIGEVRKKGGGCRKRKVEDLPSSSDENFSSSDEDEDPNARLGHNSGLGWTNQEGWSDSKSRFASKDTDGVRGMMVATGFFCTGGNEGDGMESSYAAEDEVSAALSLISYRICYLASFMFK